MLHLGVRGFPDAFLSKVSYGVPSPLAKPLTFGTVLGLAQIGYSGVGSFSFSGTLPLGRYSFTWQRLYEVHLFELQSTMDLLAADAASRPATPH